MAVIYSNFLQGTLSANITNSATSISSAAFANLPTVAAPDVMYLVLDPSQSAGAPEVVTITTHTASATSVTVTRGSQGSTARAHNSGVTWTHSWTKGDTDLLPHRVLTTKGDLIVGTGSSNVARQAVGTNDHVLMADSTLTNGVKYAQIANANVSASAAIAYSKLSLAGSIVAGDFATGIEPLIICTSTTRPASPVEGQQIYETNTNRALYHDGTGWIITSEPPTTYTPTFTNFSSTSPAFTFEYSRSNGFVDVAGTYLFGTNTSVTGAMSVSLPFTGVDAGRQVAMFGLVQGGGNNFHCWWGLDGGVNSVTMWTYNAASTASAALLVSGTNTPQTWANGHSFRMGIRYRMSSIYS